MRDSAVAAVVPSEVWLIVCALYLDRSVIRKSPPKLDLKVSQGRILYSAKMLGVTRYSSRTFSKSVSHLSGLAEMPESEASSSSSGCRYGRVITILLMMEEAELWPVAESPCPETELT